MVKKNKRARFCFSFAKRPETRPQVLLQHSARGGNPALSGVPPSTHQRRMGFKMGARKGSVVFSSRQFLFRII